MSAASCARLLSSTRSGFFCQRDLALGAERLQVRLEVGLPARRRSGHGRRARRAQLSSRVHLPQAEGRVELPAERDDLDVEVRVVGAEHLDAHLVELAIPATLRLLVAELRARVPDLPRRGRAVLHERPAHRGGELGPQRDVPAALVDEVVHLLGDHVGGVADALEHAEVFQQRRDDLPVAGTLGHLRRTPRRTGANGPIRAAGCRASRGWSGTRAQLARLPARPRVAP